MGMKRVARNLSIPVENHEKQKTFEIKRKKTRLKPDFHKVGYKGHKKRAAVKKEE